MAVVNSKTKNKDLPKVIPCSVGLTFHIGFKVGVYCCILLRNIFGLPKHVVINLAIFPVYLII